jgi:catechol 2,3-dioxygenase-like lactoylglutathione lyase family enzyme
MTHPKFAALAAAFSLLCLGGCVTINAQEAAAPAPPAAPAPEATPAPAYTGALVKRTALVVSSIDKALTIYRDILGFEVNSLTQSGPQSYSYEVFQVPRDKPIRFATLNSGPDQPRSLAMIESAGVTHKNNEGPRPVSLVLNANGRYDDIKAKITSLGLKTVRENPLPSATQGMGREWAFIDYDGHLIVIYEFPNPDRPNKM